MHVWEQRKISDLSESNIGGGTPRTSIKKYWNGRTPWIQSSDLQEHDVKNIRVNKKITEEALKESAAKLIPENSIAVVTRVGVGKVSLVSFEYSTSQDFLSLSKLLVDKWFATYLLYYKLQNELLSLQGTSIKGITKKELLAKKVQISNDQQEQVLIGQLINLLDDTIELHQRRLNIFKKLRQNYMFTMFINSEKLSPKLRFRNYKEDWVENRLREVGKTFSGLSGKTKEDFGHGEAEYVTYLNVFKNRISDLSLTEKIEIDPKQKQLRYGDVIFTTSSEIPQEVGMSSVWLDNRQNVYLNSFCFGFRPIITFNNFFLASLLRTNDFRKQMYILAQGISRYNISKSKVMNIKIHAPSLKEQEKIGKIAKNFDKEYKLLENKIFKLQKLKETFLQKMFL